MTRNLRLNSIDRFLKSSPNIHLEEYGSCEVPSGCGGVVLRWINESSPVPIDFTMRLNGKAQMWVNGQPMENRLYISKGRSVLAIQIDAPSSSAGLIQFAAKDRKGNLAFLSGQDGSWKAVLSAPQGTNWQQGDFDDSSWIELVAKPLPAPGDNDKWRSKPLEETGAVGIGFPGDHKGPIWIRKVFQYGETKDMVRATKVTLKALAFGHVSSWIDATPSLTTWGFDGQSMVQAEKGTLGLTSCLTDGYLRPGQHVLGFKISCKRGTPALLASLLAEDNEVLAATQVNSKWTTSHEEPPQDWLSADFDDSVWATMASGTFQGKEQTAGMASDTMNRTALPPAEIISPAKLPFKLFGGYSIWIRHVFKIECRKS